MLCSNSEYKRGGSNVVHLDSIHTIPQKSHYEKKQKKKQNKTESGANY